MSLSILIVEDEQIVAADLEGKLSRLGHQVVGTAASGEEAISLAEQLNPGLVLMDIRLRGSMDGTQAAQHIQRRREMPVIFITAYAEVFLQYPHLQHPPGLCLSKPFSIQQLRSVLDKVVTSPETRIRQM